MYIGVAVVAHKNLLHFNRSTEHLRLNILHGVGLEALQSVLSRLQVVGYIGLTDKALLVNMTLSIKQLIERKFQHCWLLNDNLRAKKTCAVASKLIDI